MIAILSLCFGLTSSQAGCMYRGTARDTQISEHRAQDGWVVLQGVPSVRQHSLKGCGASAVAAVRNYWGESVDEEQVRKQASAEKNTPLKAGALRESLRASGYDSFLIKGDLAKLTQELEHGRPVIVGTVKPYGGDHVITHYQVVVGIHPTQGILTMDPAEGYREYPLAGFSEEWAAAQHLALLAAPRAP